MRSTPKKNGGKDSSAAGLAAPGGNGNGARPAAAGPDSQVKGDQAQFTLTAVFKPEALLPKEEPAPAAK